VKKGWSEEVEESKIDIEEEGKDLTDKHERVKIYSKTIDADKYRKVIRLHLEMDREVLASENIEPGSYILVFPENEEGLVKEFIKMCNWEESPDLLQKLINNLDFLKPVHKEAIKLLTEGDNAVSNVKESELFNYFDLISFTKPSSPVSLEILEFIPTMKPRFYSLASDWVGKNKLEICFIVEKHEQNNIFTQGNTILKKGVCSHYLERLSESKEAFDIKLGKCSLFSTSAKELRDQPPMIFISHGTAVVPFIGVLRSIKRMIETKELKHWGDIQFYYGIHNKEYDFLYKQELEDLFEYFQSTSWYSKFKLHLAESQPSTFLLI